MTRDYKGVMPNLALVAKALSDERRAQVALTLMDGRAWTPTELANRYRWPRSSVTEHLSVLFEAGIISETRQGKHRYVRLADAEIAELIERLAAVSPADRSIDGTLKAHLRDDRLRKGRTCYGHLAGELGIRLRDGLVQSGVVDNVNGYSLTPEGLSWFDDLGYPVLSRGPADRRAIVRPCLDWTERVDHLAGIAADTLCRGFTEMGWIVRNDKDRSVLVSSTGGIELVRLGLLDAAFEH